MSLLRSDMPQPEAGFALPSIIRSATYLPSGESAPTMALPVSVTCEIV